jgi:adenosine deaminase
MIDNTIPLVDIHRHLDGNIRAQTIWQLAKHHNIELPATSLQEFLPFVTIEKSEPDLLAFLQKLDWGVAVLANLDACKRVAYENVEDAFNAGLNYAELRFSPYYMAQSYQLPVAEVVAAVIDGIEAGQKDFAVKIKLIGILSRTFGVEKCQAELNGLLAHKEKLVAIDLAGDERGFPGGLFVEHFKQVRDASLEVTVHAGEAAGSDSVWQAIKELGASRIGHGVASIHDNSLMDYMAKHQITVEACLTSNYQTGTVSDLSQHPLKTFLSHGINVCLNTDDPAVEGIEIKDEYQLAASTLALNNSQLKSLQLNGIKGAFLSASERHSLNQLISRS